MSYGLLARCIVTGCAAQMKSILIIMSLLQRYISILNFISICDVSLGWYQFTNIIHYYYYLQTFLGIMKEFYFRTFLPFHHGQQIIDIGRVMYNHFNMSAGPKYEQARLSENDCLLIVKKNVPVVHIFFHLVSIVAVE